MDNVSYKPKQKVKTTMVPKIIENSKENKSDDLRELITNFKNDYYHLLSSVNNLKDFSNKKEIYDAQIMIQNVEKSIELI